MNITEQKIRIMSLSISRTISEFKDVRYGCAAVFSVFSRIAACRGRDGQPARGCVNDMSLSSLRISQLNVEGTTAKEVRELGDGNEKEKHSIYFFNIMY